MKPLDVVLPKGTMLSPEYPAAVIAGNVETSQAVTSALFLALGVQAAAQSTMNNTRSASSIAWRACAAIGPSIPSSSPDNPPVSTTR